MDRWLGVAYGLCRKGALLDFDGQELYMAWQSGVFGHVVHVMVGIRRRRCRRQESGGARWPGAGSYRHLLLFIPRGFGDGFH